MGHVKWTAIISLAIVLLLVLSFCRTKWCHVRGSYQLGHRKKRLMSDWPCCLFFLCIYFSKQLPEMVYILWHTFIASLCKHCTCRHSSNPSVFPLPPALFHFSPCVTGLLSRTFTLPALIGGRKCGSKHFPP